jgi:hypothetical protein
MTVATDLPRRPEHEATEPTVVASTDRVRSVADKADPRFEAARRRADREDAARARAEASRAAGDPTDDGREAEAHRAAEGETAPPAPFSFNMTGDDEEEKP